MKISEILESAINLLSLTDDIYDDSGYSNYCCDCIRKAAAGPSESFASVDAPAVVFIKALGCTTKGSAFDDLDKGVRQQARALFLTFAALVAEDEGL